MHTKKIVYNTKVKEYFNSIEISHYSQNIVRLSSAEKERRKQNRLDNLQFNDFVKPYEPDKEVKKTQHSKDTSINRTINKIYEIARSEDWEYFITFTFNPNKVDRQNYDDVTTKLKNCMYYLKSNFAPDLKYLLVPELHKDKKSFHFHGVLSNVGDLDFINSGIKINDTDYIYNLEQYYLGFSNCTKVKDTKKISHYICKYITKDLCSVTQGKKRYWASRNLNKPIETFLNIPEEKKQTLSQSFGEVNYAKTIFVPQAHNKVDILQINL